MDFDQDVITTIHRLRQPSEGPEGPRDGRRDPGMRQALHRRVADLSRERKVAIVLPMLYEEMTRPAFKTILGELQRTDYVNQLYVALTADDAGQVGKVAKAVRDLPMETQVLWCESPEMKDLLASLETRGIDLAEFKGKGLAVWLGMGAASIENHALVHTDADVETYSSDMVARLVLPLLAPDMDFFFSKGYYARLTGDRMYGRVTRLFLWPFLDALEHHQRVESPFLRYMRAFRYPLAGEFAVSADLALNVRVPTDWGLELGLLGEVYRNTSLKRICQVDLGVYSHKHKPFDVNKAGGLHRMVKDLVTTLLRLTMENEGMEVSAATLLSLRVSYRRIAQDYVRRYYVDAVANGLVYDRHEEELMIDTFAGLIEAAGEAYVRKPGREQIPDWLRTLSAEPDFHRRVNATALRAGDREAMHDGAIRATRGRAR